MSNYSRSRQEINRLQKVYTPVRSRNKGSMTRELSQPKINGSEANSGVKTLA